VDFGLAKKLTSTEVGLTGRVGTKEYMAPEIRFKTSVGVYDANTLKTDVAFAVSNSFS
jgi:serine/threonine protein kinase